MRALSCKHCHLVKRTAVLLFCGLLFLSNRPFPPTLEQQLKHLREKDDLAGWLYLQIQWVAKVPVSRAGQLQQAVSEAWRPPSSNEEIQAWQDLLINAGYALLISGDIVRSTDSYTAAFQWARQHIELADDSIVLENILKPLGNNYTRLGDYEQALFIHRKALAIANALGEPLALAGTYSNLANTASNMGQAAEALDYCRRGLGMAKGSSPLRGLLLSEQADALVQLGQPAAARESIQESVAMLERSSTPESSYWLFTAYQQAGDIYLREPKQALAYYQKALTLEQRLSREHGPLHQRQKAKLFQRIGSLYANTDRPALAAHWLDQCLSVLIPGKPLDSLREKDLYGENTLMDLLFTAAGLAGAQGSTDKSLRLYKLCFTAEINLRRELITGNSRERAVSDSHLRYEEAIRTAWAAWESTSQPSYRQAMLEFMEGSKARLLLDEVLQQQQLARTAGTADSLGDRIRLLEKAIIYYKKEALEQTGGTDSLSQAMAAREKQAEWDLARLRKKMGVAASGTSSPFGSRPHSYPYQLTRSFFAGTAALYVVECDQKGIRFADKIVMSEGWQDSIRAFIHTWFEKGAGNMINSPQDYYRQAYRLYRRLFGAHPLQTGREYILLPDGPLNLLPVDALVTVPACPPSPSDWLFVIRQSSISYAWSLRTLEEQMSSPGNSKGFSGFFLSDTRQLPRLNNIASEEKSIPAIIDDGTWYKDDKATTAAFRQALQASAVVHISSHAFSGKETAQVPHIELYDQPFYLFELKDLRQHPSLVVLSACRTGDGRLVTGEGVQSLARAFTAEGTNAVVAGWWNVNDVAAARLMENFYRIWTPDKRTNIASALRQSKLDWLYDPQVSYQHKLPYYWAALNYAGSPEPLKNTVTPKGPVALWWVIAILVAVAGLSVALLRFRR
ncbi:CHAT domain-containing protein [Flavitalea sp. BT771]|uniref:CHAT domain-containing protein n=1 Tax=Flavitalea sp. BT771 TaxID=3063329 RepID=UPI0026E48E31|nr:CHAT domain-containing protein [Flavitalea sp. BT771]MDO6432391.1 CHAT domain-containing protein [Flavitalea sp. BT771]MDV6221301.1 CHAT domain-containing protein [Flavitalea sp. BT771]